PPRGPPPRAGQVRHREGGGPCPVVLARPLPLLGVHHPHDRRHGGRGLDDDPFDRRRHPGDHRRRHAPPGRPHVPRRRAAPVRGVRTVRKGDPRPRLRRRRIPHPHLPPLKKKSDSFRDFVLEQLGDGVTCRAMFGGYGLYRGVAFFGILWKGRLYFRTGPLTRKEYVSRGMKPFKPNAKMTSKTYYEVPADILEDREQLV